MRSPLFQNRVGGGGYLIDLRNQGNIEDGLQDQLYFLTVRNVATQGVFSDMSSNGLASGVTFVDDKDDPTIVITPTLERFPIRGPMAVRVAESVDGYLEDTSERPERRLMSLVTGEELRPRRIHVKPVSERLSTDPTAFTLMEVGPDSVNATLFISVQTPPDESLFVKVTFTPDDSDVDVWSREFAGLFDETDPDHPILLKGFGRVMDGVPLSGPGKLVLTYGSGEGDVVLYGYVSV